MPEGDAICRKKKKSKLKYHNVAKRKIFEQKSKDNVSSAKN